MPPLRDAHPVCAQSLDQLAGGIAELVETDAWQRYLDFQARLPHYSFRNTLLIRAQCPEASYVASRSGWKKLGRTVPPGASAIWVLAPMRRREAGDRSEARLVLAGFRWTEVFDVAATEGGDLALPCARIEGDDPAGAFDRLAALGRSWGFTVVDHRFEGLTCGDCSHRARRIRVGTALSPAQRTKTLAHELAHAAAHADAPDRALAELEAESVAWIVCRALGIDASGYSFGYLASWAGGGDVAIRAISASAGRIQRCAASILNGLDAGGERIVALATASG